MQEILGRLEPSRSAELRAAVSCTDVTDRAMSISVRAADMVATDDTVARSISGSSVVVWTWWCVRWTLRPRTTVTWNGDLQTEPIEAVQRRRRRTRCERAHAAVEDEGGQVGQWRRRRSAGCRRCGVRRFEGSLWTRRRSSAGYPAAATWGAVTAPC